MSTTAPPRSIVAWLFVVGGAILLLETLTLVGPFASLTPGVFGSILTFIARAALAVAYALLALETARDPLVRVAFILAAVGWALLALIALIPGVGALGAIASLLALIGMLGSGIRAFLGHYFSRNADIVYLVMTIVAALVMLNGMATFLVGYAGTVFGAVFAALLVVTGVAVLQRR